MFSCFLTLFGFFLRAYLIFLCWTGLFAADDYFMNNPKNPGVYTFNGALLDRAHEVKHSSEFCHVRDNLTTSILFSLKVYSVVPKASSQRYESKISFLGLISLLFFS